MDWDDINKGWYKDGLSGTYYPSEGSFGYAIVVSAVADSTFTLTIKAVPPGGAL